MRVARPLLLLVSLLAIAVAAGGAQSAVTAPTGLHAFLLRADETGTSFATTPSFAWNPVPGAIHYEFDLSLSDTFRDNSVVYAQPNAPTPVVAPPITLPWISGSPHSLYARVRAITPTGATPWSAAFGFDMTPPPPPTPLVPSFPGLLRWNTVPGASAYEVWLLDAQKMEYTTTNTLDERDAYTFHTDSSWTGTIHWRIRALRTDTSTTGRIDGIPAVQYGPWSTNYTSTNPTFATGPITLLDTVSTTISNGQNNTPAHPMMPAFVWTGDQALNGQSAQLYRVYVFTDKQCLNRVFTSAVVGSPAYSPRALGPMALPATSADLANAASLYLTDGTEPPSITFDGDKIAPTESLPDATPTTTIPGTLGATTTTTPGSSSDSSSSSDPSSSGSSSSGSASSGGFSITGRVGAPTDLWDTSWPSSGYYWTVVPVLPVSPGFLQTTTAGGSKLGATTVSVANGAGFRAGDAVTIGTGKLAETAVIASVSGDQLTFAVGLVNGHGSGDLVVRKGGNLIYTDLELPQDVCASGRVMRFGKESQPSLTSQGGVFATGLSSTGRLTSAVNKGAFYGQPLVSWTPALSADAYEVQWSKTQYPFTAQPTITGSLGVMTLATSLVLPLVPGTWYYRVRGFDYSLPTGAQEMSWSTPAKIVVAAPKFSVVGAGTTTKKPAPKKKKP